MEFKQAHRLENLHVSGTRVVFGKCAELAAQGIPVTALTLGQPDFDTPQYIIDACKKALDEGKTRYTDGSGIQELKEAVCQKLEKENGLHYTPSEISVTTGVAQGMFVALLSTLNPGDEVLVPDPVYLTYSEIPNIAGAVIKKYDLLEENDYQVDVDQIRSLITDKTKMLVIVSPSNPTGGVLSRASLEAIAAIAREHDLLVLSDEIYDRFVYDDEQELVSIASLPGMKERSIVLNGFSKSMAMTGWRLGYALAPQNIMDRIKQYHDFNTVGAPSPLMEAAVVGLDMPDSYYQEFGAHYAHMKKLFTDGLKQIGIPFTDPQGAYFVLADIGPYMRKGESDVDFCLEMAEKVGVACVPGTSFFNENVNHIVRVHFAKKDETLYEALERLSHLKEKMG